MGTGSWLAKSQICHKLNQSEHGMHGDMIKVTYRQANKRMTQLVIRDFKSHQLKKITKVEAILVCTCTSLFFNILQKGFILDIKYHQATNIM